MKTKMRFAGGLRTIGGNIVEIVYGNDRVIFDFGRAYNPADTLLTNAAGREGRRVADMLRLGMLPAIDGLYAQADLAQVLANAPAPPAPPAPFEASVLNTAVFISHLHLDHMGAIDALAPGVPVYMSQEGAALHEVIMATGEPPQRQSVRGVPYGQPVQVGDIAVTFHAVDHDVHGAAAIYVKTPSASYACSGDIRMHGQYPEKNHRWVQAMRDASVDYLLMEGTSIWAPRDDGSADNAVQQLNEGEVPAAIQAALTQATGVAFFNCYHRNTDRLKALAAAARATGRTLVLEPATAKVAAAFFSQGDDDVPAAFCSQSGDRVPTAAPPPYGVLGEQIDVAQINQNPAAYFVQNSFAHIFSLIDYDPAGSVYVHTNGIPLGAFDPAYGSMLSFLQTLGIRFALVPSTGHGDAEALRSIIDGIAPKVLVPWHSTAPEYMTPINPAQEILLPQEGVWYER